MANATDTQEKLKKQFNEAVQTAKTLRDQIKVELHLAALDARDEWKKIEPQLAEVEKFGDDVSDAAQKAASSVAKSFQDFKARLKANNTR